MTPKLTPKHLTKQEFGRRLYQLMLEKGWRQSELARQAGIQRNAVSTYVLGKALPTDINLRRLAQVFKMKPEELLPNHMHSAIDSDNPMVSIQVSPNAPNKAWLRVNQLVDTALAVKIIGMLQASNDDTSK
jgi:transcriptional regulator with XRE-family HTH domain